MISIGQKHTSELKVIDTMTAIEVGSGDMPVLATPMMMALMENAAMLAVKDDLPDGINLFDFTLTKEDFREIRMLDTGRNVTGWPSDALKYNPEIV